MAVKAEPGRPFDRPGSRRSCALGTGHAAHCSPPAQVEDQRAQEPITPMFFRHGVALRAYVALDGP